MNGPFVSITCFYHQNNTVHIIDSDLRSQYHDDTCQEDAAIMYQVVTRLSSVDHCLCMWCRLQYQWSVKYVSSWYYQLWIFIKNLVRSCYVAGFKLCSTLMTAVWNKKFPHHFCTWITVGIEPLAPLVVSHHPDTWHSPDPDTWRYFVLGPESLQRSPVIL